LLAALTGRSGHGLAYLSCGAATANDAAQASCHAGMGRSVRPPTPCAAAGSAVTSSAAAASAAMTTWRWSPSPRSGP